MYSAERLLSQSSPQVLPLPKEAHLDSNRFLQAIGFEAQLWAFKYDRRKYWSRRLAHKLTHCHSQHNKIPSYRQICRPFCGSCIHHQTEHKSIKQRYHRLQIDKVYHRLSYVHLPDIENSLEFHIYGILKSQLMVIRPNVTKLVYHRSCWESGHWSTIYHRTPQRIPSRCLSYFNYCTNLLPNTTTIISRAQNRIGLPNVQRSKKKTGYIDKFQHQH